MSVGGGLLCKHMETWSVSTCTVDFVVGVNKKLGGRSGLFENCNSLFSTQGAIFGSKGPPCEMALQVIPPHLLTGDGCCC